MKGETPIFYQLRELERRIQEPSLSALLALTILVLFIIGPVDNYSDGKNPWATQFVVAVMSLISIFAVSQLLIRCFALFSFTLSVVGVIVSHQFSEPAISQSILAASALLNCGTISWIIGRKIFDEGPVTLHRIRGAITVYLNIAIAFALVDSLLVLWLPNAYLLPATETKGSLSTMIYFSLTTLTSTGYGDIIPVDPYARSVANLEAVVGQFYLGGLIATLISLHVADRQKQKIK